MSGLSRFLIRLLSVSALAAIVGAGQTARAQDDEDEEAPAPVQAPGVMVINEAQFDQWLFGQLGVGNVQAARNKAETLLTLSVEDLERTCDLKPIQQKKLLLAGRGDIKRYFDRVEEARKKFQQTVKNNPNQFGLIWQDIQTLQSEFHEVLGEGSIFGTMLKSSLSPEQLVEHEKVVRDRLLYRYWARVDLVMEMLNNNVGFTDEQRDRLVKLLAQETRPPRRLGQNDYYAVLYMLSLIPEAKLKPIFEDVQYRSLKQQFDQVRGMGMWLKQTGFVAEGDEPQTKPVVLRPRGARVMIQAVPLVPAVPKAAAPAVKAPATPRN
jgi:hypothetical protein